MYMYAKRGKEIIDNNKSNIVIDENQKWVFPSEKEMLLFFKKEINLLENEFNSLRSEEDIDIKNFCKYEKYLNLTIDNPQEIWNDKNSIEGFNLYIYISSFEQKDNSILYYIVIAHIFKEVPTFIYLHFPTNDKKIVDNYRRGEWIFNKKFSDIEFGMLEGDALSDGDEMAMGLFQAMLKLRSEKDLSYEKFNQYGKLREETIENADEIWKNNDLDGNIFVNFIKEFHDEGPDNKSVFYVVVTQEETSSNVHLLLFSFPTADITLLERYRYGENLHAEDISQESSH